MLLLFLSTLGCVSDSKNPLTNPDKEQIDASILGTWAWEDEKESGFIHIGLDKRSKLLRLIMVDFDKDKALFPEMTYVHKLKAPNKLFRRAGAPAD